jgi:hypothetical protein
MKDGKSGTIYLRCHPSEKLVGICAVGYTMFSAALWVHTCPKKFIKCLWNKKQIHSTKYSLPPSEALIVSESSSPPTRTQVQVLIWSVARQTTTPLLINSLCDIRVSSVATRKTKGIQLALASVNESMPLRIFILQGMLKELSVCAIPGC